MELMTGLGRRLGEIPVRAASRDVDERQDGEYAEVEEEEAEEASGASSAPGESFANGLDVFSDDIDGSEDDDDDDDDEYGARERENG